MQIYLKISKDAAINNIYDLILYGYYGNNGESIYSYKFHRTYKDKECTIEECHPARRSFEDLLKICKTYFPNTTEVELALTLEKLRIDKKISCLYCNTINKLVFISHKSSAELSFTCYVHKSEINTKGNGKYCLKDILNLIENNKN